LSIGELQSFGIAADRDGAGPKFSRAKEWIAHRHQEAQVRDLIAAVIGHPIVAGFNG